MNLTVYGVFLSSYLPSVKLDDLPLFWNIENYHDPLLRIRIKNFQTSELSPLPSASHSYWKKYIFHIKKAEIFKKHI